VLLECKIFHVRPVRADVNRPVLAAYAPHQLVWAHRYAEANGIALLAEYDVSRRELAIFLMTQPEHFEKASLVYPHCFRSELDCINWASIEAYRAFASSWYLLTGVEAHRNSLQDKPRLLR
jgi:hypothetical protein